MRKKYNFDILQLQYQCFSAFGNLVLKKIPTKFLLKEIFLCFKIQKKITLSSILLYPVLQMCCIFLTTINCPKIYCMFRNSIAAALIFLDFNQLNQFHAIFFLTKIPFLQFQKWPKINFWTGKKFKTAKNAISRKFFDLFDFTSFLPGLFLIFWPAVPHKTWF